MSSDRSENQPRKPRDNKRKPTEDQQTPDPHEHPIIKDFRRYSAMLDDKNDRHERLVKASRDITIESKRIIFLLHRIDPAKNNRDAVLQEASDRLNKLCSSNFSIIARELVGRDTNQYYQYLRAFSAGCQEFIEAYVYYMYLQGEELPDWTTINAKLRYKSANDEEFSLDIDPKEFILGYADFTGELMRYCINSLSSGGTDICQQVCRTLQQIYAKFMTVPYIHNRNRDFTNKLATLRSSTLKCENVCYNLKIRGTEGLKLVHFDALNQPSLSHDDDIDEGIY